jgi:hypothetical protein
MTLTDPEARARFVRGAMPEGGLFAGMDWRIAPEAFPLEKKRVEELEQLGQRLYVFQQACNLLYRQSVLGRAPAYVAQWLDAGKPAEVVALSRDKALKNLVPDVIRPDLLLASDGWTLAEIDSVPGGIGVSAWMNETYAALGEPVLGGGGGIRDAVKRLLPEGVVVLSEEAAAYGPEWRWLLGADRVKAAEKYRFNGEPVYRFFEGFDWMKLDGLRGTWTSGQRMTPPLKPYLEEKLWLALFWLRPLRDFWRQQLGERYFRDLQKIIPMSWVMDPSPLPPTAVLPGLEVQNWEEVAAFSQKERDLILKISGFSEQAWGSRGVVLGSDVSAQEWSAAVKEALDAFPLAPRVLQRFQPAQLVGHAWWNEEENRLVDEKLRARICPFYFVEEGRAHLKAVHCTLCPADKKLIHGMRDAVIVPAKAVPQAV